MILPIGQDDTELRRFPWLATALVGAALISFVLIWRTDGETAQRTGEARAAAIEYFEKKPYLALGDDAAAAMFPELGAGERELAVAELRRGYPHRVFEFQLAMDQPELDLHTRRLLEAQGERISRRLGLVPAAPTALGWVAHPFAQGEPVALAIGLLFLFLAGYSLEERWGRALFLGFVVSAVAVSAYMLVQRAPGSQEPWVGMAGASAGLMGAFAARFGLSKMRCIYWLLLYSGTLRAPGFILVALWAAAEVAHAVWQGALVGAGSPDEWARGVAFAWGFGFAAVLRLARIEERFINPRLEARITVADNSVVEEALALREEGQDDRALALLEKALAKDPTNGAIAMALWETAKGAGRANDVVPALERVLRRDLQAGRAKLALNQLREISKHAPDARVDPALLVRLAQVLQKQAARPEASFVLSCTVPAGDGAWPGALAAQIVERARTLSPELTQEVSQIALRSKDLDPELREALEAELQPALVPDDDPAAAEVFEYGAVSLAEAEADAEDGVAEAAPSADESCTPFEMQSTFDLGASDGDFLDAPEPEKEPE